jgi:hypothetical protein
VQRADLRLADAQHDDVRRGDVLRGDGQRADVRAAVPAAPDETMTILSGTRFM